VSEITDRECRQLLERPSDVILWNGFEDNFVPHGSTFDGKRKRARSLMLSVANNLLGTNLQDSDTIIIGTSGRYEFKNKGIDLFIEAMNRVRHDNRLEKNILAYITVPGWVKEPRQDLSERMKSRQKFTTPLDCPYITHWLNDMGNDRVTGMMNYLGMHNDADDKVKVIFVPCYLDGKDGIFNKEYYDVLLGEDLSIYASYYEPWGYTPLESVAFKVPTVTTDLAGFGLWVKNLKGYRDINDGVEVLHRSDSNYFDIAENLKETVINYCNKSDSEKNVIRENASKIAEQALWKHFISQYYKAYDVALRNAAIRISE
jgi:glycosyltransferase involved in cell wall biosynthesis